MAINWQQLINSNSAAPIPNTGGAGALPSAAAGPTLNPPSTGNPSAVSSGGASPFGYSPVGGDPNILGKLADLVYSVPAGGYITSAEANNSNSAQSKYNLQDPMANQLAKSIYDYIGGLPTQANTTSALAKLYAQTGQKPSTGPSYEERLGHPWEGPWEIQPEHPSSQPRYGGYGAGTAW